LLRRLHDLNTHAALLRGALLRFGGALLVLATLFFWTAGTARYWQAWLYLGVLLGPMAVATTWLLGHDPALLERRMRMREPRAGQRTLVALSALALFVVFAIPGLDRRLGWSSVAPAIVLAADLIVLAGYGLFFRVLQVNHHASRVVEVEPGQQVVTTGPYRWVRHPMYVAVTAMFAASPLALGSAWGVMPALAFPLFLVARIRGEERLLRDELPGYREYMAKTRYRLIPGVW